ncbi:MAG: hypothetical protein E7596_05220 [Ruminococcaceae bacterium]|nr:hypothetical protein [Oscillospiraceae bacterium]
MNSFKNKAKSFLNGYYYPLLIFLTALMAHTFSLELLGAAIFFITATAGFIFCEDLKFLISPLIMFILMFSQKSVASGIFFTKPYLIAMVCCAIYIIALFFAHFIIYKKLINFKSFLKSKLFLGYILISVAFLLNGFLNFDEYSFGNIVFALALIGSFGVVFLIFNINLNSENLVKYLFFVLYLVSLLVTLELFFSFFNQIRIVNGEIVKESILLGWGMWNNVGGMLSFLLPIHFYYASTTKKFGFLFYGSGILSYLAIVLTLSRSSLLVSSLIIVACAIIGCFCGENKKINRIITASVAIIGCVGIIVLWEKISGILGDYIARGFDDNGRFEIYKKGFKNFLSNPIFGGGFCSVDAQEHQFISFLPDRYHNTIIQLLGACGIVGLSAYLFHRYQTIKLLWQKRSLSVVFAFLCILSLLLTSMLDNHFFNIYPGFIYTLILVTIEKSSCEK